MFFLPGTFVSVSTFQSLIIGRSLEIFMTQALFSMVFFDTKTNVNGGESLLVGSQWWLFPAITIPLTILVFAVWIWWQRHRNRMDSTTLGTGQPGDFVKPVPILRQNFRQGYHNRNLMPRPWVSLKDFRLYVYFIICLADLSVYLCHWPGEVHCFWNIK